MKSLPNLIPVRGGLEQRIFENSSLNLPLCLIHRIDVEFEPIELEGESVSTELRLDFIDLPVKSWREIANRTFEFPVNPEDGYIDGSVYLFSVHNPADVTKLEFGDIKDHTISVTITVAIDFTIEGDSDYGVVPLRIATVLDISALKPFSWVQHDLGDDPERLSQAISGLVNLDDYEHPVLSDKVIRYELKGEQ